MKKQAKKLAKLYRVSPSKKIVEVEGFETREEAVAAAGGVPCWILTGWQAKEIVPAVRHFNGRKHEYYFRSTDGTDNHFDRWHVIDHATFKEAKAALLAELEGALACDRAALANDIKKRNAVRSLRAPKKANSK